MKLRILVVKNEVTAEQIQNYSMVNDVSFAKAKAILVNEQPPKLQYYDWPNWVDVPIEYQEHP